MSKELAGLSAGLAGCSSGLMGCGCLLTLLVTVPFIIIIIIAIAGG